MAEELGEDREECARIMREADKDEDGTLNWEEFMRVVKKTSYF
jgi:Ca2+-binding EF-hand superfamily protein